MVFFSASRKAKILGFHCSLPDSSILIIQVRSFSGNFTREGKIFSVLNELNPTPWRRIVKVLDRCIFSWSLLYLEVGSQLSLSGRLTAEERAPRHSLNRRLGRPQSWSGRYGEENILDHTGTRILITFDFQTVSSRYTYWAIPALIRDDVVKRNGL
jgi:hypothetical protein